MTVSKTVFTDQILKYSNNVWKNKRTSKIVQFKLVVSWW